jgi:hypothetical protein
MGRTLKIAVGELVVVGLLGGIFGAVFTHACERPAHAGVTDDAQAVRRSLEHIERMVSNKAKNPGLSNWYVP